MSRANNAMMESNNDPDGEFEMDQQPNLSQVKREPNSELAPELAGGENRNLIPANMIKKRLRHLLQNLETFPGAFSAHEILKDAPNPGLLADDHPIGFPFPLSLKDVEVIKSISDVQTRNIWQISAQFLKTGNPSWSSLVTSVAREACDRIGVNQITQGCEASLLCLILYETGNDCGVLSNRDESLSTFGFIDFVLPSKHSDDGIVLEYEDKQSRFLASQKSEYDCAYVAWFSDVTVKQSPLQAGYRLVLRYKLQHTKPIEVVSSASLLHQQSRELRLILSSWKKQPDVVGRLGLGYILSDSQIWTAPPSEIMYGKDEIVLAHLQEASDKLGFYVCFSDLLRKASGTGNENALRSMTSHEIRGKFDFKMTLSHFVDIDGSKPFGELEVSFEEEQIIQKGFFQSLEPDNIDYDVHRSSLTYAWRCRILLLVPKYARMCYIIGYSDSNIDMNQSVMSQKLDRLFEERQSACALSDTRLDALQICNIVTDHSLSETSSDGYTDEFRSKVFRAIISLDDKDLFLQTVLVGFEDMNAFQHLKIMMDRHGLSWIHSCLDYHIAQTSSLSERLKILHKLNKYLQDSEWLDRQYSLALTAHSCLSIADGKLLSNVAAQWANNPLLFTTLLPVLKSVSKSLRIILAFLVAVEIEDPSKLFVEAILIDTVSKISVSSSDPATMLEKQPEPLPGQPRLPPVLTQYALDVIQILNLCHKDGFEEPFAKLAAKLSNKVMETHSQYHGENFIPFLRVLVPVLQKGTSPRRQRFQTTIASILNSYISTCPAKPQAPTWTRPKRGCGAIVCQHCIPLDEFLVNPSQIAYDFTTTAIGRIHIQKRLEFEVSAQSVEFSLLSDRGSAVLRVTKIAGIYNVERRRWAIRCEDMRKRIRGISIQGLKSILGDLELNSIIALKTITNRDVAAPPSTHFVDLANEDDSDSSKTDDHPAISSTAPARIQNDDLQRAPGSSLGNLNSNSVNQPATYRATSSQEENEEDERIKRQRLDK